MRIFLLSWERKQLETIESDGDKVIVPMYPEISFGKIDYNFFITSSASGGTNGIPVLEAMVLYNSANLTP
jgi:hypothetical protein